MGAHPTFCALTKSTSVTHKLLKMTISVTLDHCVFISRTLHSTLGTYLIMGPSLHRLTCTSKSCDLFLRSPRLTSHSDCEAAGSFVPRAVKHSVGQLVKPLWEVGFGRFPFQDNTAKDRLRFNLSLWSRCSEKNNKTNWVQHERKRLERWWRCDLTLSGCHQLCPHPPVCPRSPSLSVCLVLPTCPSD